MSNLDKQDIVAQLKGRGDNLSLQAAEIIQTLINYEKTTKLADEKRSYDGRY